METQREASAYALFLCKCRPFETSYISRGDCFAAMANCYGDEAVAPSFVRFTELLSSSFHCSVLRVLKLEFTLNTFAHQLLREYASVEWLFRSAFSGAAVEECHRLSLQH